MDINMCVHPGHTSRKGGLWGQRPVSCEQPLSGWAVGLEEKKANSDLRGENPSKPRLGWMWLWQAAGPGAR